MADEEKEARPVRAGESQPGKMRRIGYRHAVFQPAVRAQLVDINDVENQLATVNRTIPQAQQTVADLLAQRNLLEQRLAEFRAAPVERFVGDPEVPLDAPAPDTAPGPEPAPRKRRG